MYKNAVGLIIEGQRVDLFEGDAIVVNKSVQNVRDVTKVFDEFSQSFSVPASQNNNKIFKDFWNYDIVNGFDARIRHVAILELASFTFKQGSIRLEKGVLKNKRIESYKLTFFGHLIDLKSQLGDRYLSGLDFTDLTFLFDSDTIKTGLQSGLFSGDIKFPLISTQKQWFYDSNVGNTSNFDQETNIASNGSVDVHGVLWSNLRPALRQIRILEKIEESVGITFSRDFFGGPAFSDLYLWLANEDTEEALKNTTDVGDYDTFGLPFGIQSYTLQPAIGSFNPVTGVYSVTNYGAPKLRNVVVITESSDNVTYSIQLMNNNEVVAEETGVGQLKIDQDLFDGVDPGSQLRVRIVAVAAKVITLVRFEIDELSDDEVLNAIRNADITIDTVEANLNDFVPNIKLIDLMEWWVKKYNLVIIPESKTEFKIQTLNEWYEDGAIYDVSAYLDQQEMDVNRGVIYKDIKFNFEEGETILADQFRRNNNVGYGDLETTLFDNLGNPLDGGELEIKVGFEQMVYERLFDLDTNEITNIVYGASIDRGLSSTLPKAHALYIITKGITAKPISFINDTNTMEQILNVNMPAHVNDNANPEHSTVFGSSINEHTGVAIQNSLYAVYWQDYLVDVFSKRRRMISGKMRLPFGILNNLKMNDRWVIDGTRFVLNTLKINLVDQMVDFEIMNDIYSLDADQAVEDDEVVEEPVENVVIVTPVDRVNVAKSFSISTAGTTSQIDACGFVLNSTKFWVGNEGYPFLGDTIYLESTAENVFNGNNLYYKIANDRLIQISSSGRVINNSLCQAGGGVANQ